MTERLKLFIRHSRTGPILLLASLLASPAVSSATPPENRRAQARPAYEGALRMRAALESQPEKQRRKADYEKVIRAYQAVYRLNPGYSKSPVVLGAVAGLYQEMGQVFGRDDYYLQAIKAYQFLRAQYPLHRLSREALFLIGEIYRADLEDSEAARKVFEEFLARYPKSPRASGAQGKLRQINELLADRAAGRSTGPSSPVANHRGGPIQQVTALRHWVGPNYTRVVIGVEGEVKFEVTRLSNPDRIVLDLTDTRLSPVLAGKAFPVESGFLRQVRIGQFKPTVTRVVLDVEKIEDYSVFPLPNPFRFVIDIHGTPTAVAETSSPPKPTGAEKIAAPPTEPPRPVTKTPATAPSLTSKAQETAESAKQPETAARGTNAKAEVEVMKPSAAEESSRKETATAQPPPLPAKSSSLATPPPGAAPPVKPAAPTESGARTLTRALGLKVGRIVIDPGHGGHDTGTIGPTGLCEKDLVLAVGLQLKKLIEQQVGSEVIMTRSDDTFIPLEERTAIANQNAADLFVSIHANASRDRRARGIETYYLNFTSNPEALEVAARENATSQESVHQLQDLIKKIALTEKIEESQEFANLVQREVHSVLAKAGAAQKDRGVKKAPFVVLIGANMPSILAEISFLTNPRDERMLKRPDYRLRIAKALYQGIVRYMHTLGGVKVAQKASASGSPPADSPNF